MSAQPAEHDAIGESRQSVLLVRAGAAVCALPLAAVEEILRPLPVQPVMDVPDYVSGLALLRGSPVPVLSLALLMGADEAAVTRWVSLRCGSRFLALAVAAVDSVRELDAGAWQALPGVLGDQPALAALSTRDGELLRVLATARLLPAELWQRLVPAA